MTATILNDPAKLARYRRLMRISGGNREYALRMVGGELFPAPGTCSDREFYAGKGTLADQFEGEEQILGKVVAAARDHGYNPSPNDVYTPALADFPGDPAAFVSGDARGHIRRVCEGRGEECHGLVNVKRSEIGVAPDDGPAIAEDLVHQAVVRRVKKDPSLMGKRKRLRQDFIAKHSPE